MFSRQGIPAIVMSDNGPEFSSNLFKLFARDWKFDHVTSSPNYPQSNGQVERTVQTIKNILKKTSHDGSDFRLAMLEYLNTPLGNDVSSPAELLYSKRLRSIVPCSPKLLQPKVQKNVATKLQLLKDRQKYYCDRGARELKTLSIGDKVKVLLNNQWVNGTVHNIFGPRSYLVRLQSGGVLRRNRRHIITRPRHTASDSSNVITSQRYYDDIVIGQGQSLSQASSPAISSSPVQPEPQTNTNPIDNLHRTRFGRIVRPPDRWGFPAASSTSHQT